MVSEYLGCHIFNLLGVKAQKTLLGTYNHHGKTHHRRRLQGLHFD